MLGLALLPIAHLIPQAPEHLGVGRAFLPLQDGGPGTDGNRERQTPEANPVVQ
jgi:hypothetical protein